MAIEPGQTLLHYRIIEKIGEGGMGVVWKALDTTLDREVAIKLLPEELAGQAERLARFEREAKVLASIQHPNIAVLHGLHESDGVHFLTMELVSGEDLAQRLKGGPLSIEETLGIGLQIAGALEAAHERGVIHRDLKPANVKVAADGNVKVLDFGLAKMLAAEPASGDPAFSPTVTSGGTRDGMILGTATYMSPEQARGRPLDKRTDIWSFGCVLYEMLCGRRAFEGDSITDVLAAIVKEAPDFAHLPASTPVAVRRLLQRCLVKNPRDRLRDVGDARLEIAGSDAEPVDDRRAASAPTRAPAPWTFVGRAVPWIAVAVLLLVVTLRWEGQGLREAARPVRMQVEVPAASAFPAYRGTLVGPLVVLSPDGTRMVFVAGSWPDTRLQLRSIDSLDAIELPGTEGAGSPFFSPDGRQIGFFADRKLKAVSISGTTARTLCDAQVGAGGSWSEGGAIVFARPWRGGPLLQVPATGGEPVAATRLDEKKGEILHAWPQVLPDGERVLFTSATRKGDFEEATIEVESIGTGERTRLVEGGYFGRYLSSGHLVYVRRGALLAVRFDVERLEVNGAPVAVVEDLLVTPRAGGAQLSFSTNGHLVYRVGSEPSETVSAVWVDREGRSETLLEEEGVYYSPRFSPDGRRISMHVGGDPYSSRTSASDVWIYDLERGTMTRFTLDPAPEYMPIWTPDGRRLTFGSERDGGTSHVYWKRADGSGEVERLTAGEHGGVPCSWSPDGRALVFLHRRGLWVLSLGEDGRPEEPKPLIATPFSEWRAEVSPDGRWLAYTSNESGRYEVYVTSFPEPGPKWQISSNVQRYGNIFARWSRDTRELFYWDGQRMMKVTYEADRTSFRPGKPHVLFEGAFADRGWPDWDVSPDGLRFVMFLAGDKARTAPTETIFVLNWFTELERLVPGD